MPRKLSPEEAAVLIIRRRLRQMEEDKMSQREAGSESRDEKEKLSDSVDGRPGRRKTGA